MCVFTFQDLSVLRLATHGLNTAEGGAQPTGISGFSHNGQDFFARIDTQDLAAVQAMSQDGIDQSPTHTVHFADADKFVYLNTSERRDSRAHHSRYIWSSGSPARRTSAATTSLSS
jgi:hypothetical protein